MRPPVRRSHGEIPTSSMADIAFLLLIFFLVTTVFQEEKGLPIVLPDSREIDVVVAPNNVMHLIVRPDGLVDVRAGNSGLTRTVGASAIPLVWRTAHARNPRLIAALRTHPDAAYSRMIDVLDALRSAGAQRVSLQELDVSAAP